MLVIIHFICVEMCTVALKTVAVKDKNIFIFVICMYSKNEVFKEKCSFFKLSI